MQYVRDLPINDTPEIFGLHDNANITYAQNQALTQLAELLKLQPKTASGGGKSREEVMYLYITGLWLQLYSRVLHFGCFTISEFHWAFIFVDYVFKDMCVFSETTDIAVAMLVFEIVGKTITYCGFINFHGH